MVKARAKRPAPTVRIEDIPVEQLVLDDENPRFATPSAQAALFAKYAENPKTHKLARHIVDHGMDPLSSLGVDRVGNRRYTVREGNRRTAALRLLHAPQLAGTERYIRKFQEIRDAGKYLPPSVVRCAIFDKKTDIHEWMMVKHAGTQEGVGTDNWSPLQTSRFNTRTGRDHQYAIAQQVIDQAIEDGLITEEDGAGVATSSLARVLNDANVQKALHARKTDRGLRFALDPSARQRLTKQLISDWSGGKSVREVDTAGQRKAYAEKLAVDLDLSPDDTPEESSGTHTTTARSTSRVSRRSTGPRKNLIPRHFAFDDAKALPRIARIVAELRNLDVDKHPNAVSMLFRLLMEASVDRYLKTHSIKVERNANGNLPELSKRVELVTSHIRSTKPDSKQALKSIRTAFSERTGIFALTTLHEYVHNATWQPLPDHLRVHWDNYSEFIGLLWE